ncbi:hypothetical protein [Marinicella gelatinilytica]|uniref:hypothetical protein n=1 Tax=Marinicella gelatinilytica TaxID=2996017 RepID=UPI002260E310|nr:hypothetical protein [Marinicella gelatinilytica]MCX7545003.1 hypothetical protein [Marinicella gelatinilytica]
MKLNYILLTVVMLPSCALVNSKHENHIEGIGSQQKVFVIKRSYIGQIAETIFADVKELGEAMDSECASDPRTEDGSYIWVCFLKPKPVEIKGKFLTTPPDTGEWMLNLNFKENTYQLRKSWVHNAQNHGGVIKKVYIERMAQSVLSDLSGSINHTNTSCEIDKSVADGHFVWVCNIPNISTYANSGNKKSVSGSNNRMLIINFKENTYELNML